MIRCCGAEAEQHGGRGKNSHQTDSGHGIVLQEDKPITIRRWNGHMRATLGMKQQACMGLGT
jgi:hypothetical protein